MQRRDFGRMLMALAAGPAWAMDRAPDRGPMKILVPFGAGGVADLTARVMAQQLSRSLGQSVVIDNRPGAGGVVATDTVAKSQPDGNTLLLMSNATAISAALFKSLPFDIFKDLEPVALIGSFDLAVLVSKQSPIASFEEFVSSARRQPGALNIGTINKGSTQHLSAELLLSVLGVKAEVVPFNGTPALLNALRGGQVDLGVEVLAPTLSQVRAGTLRALATLGAKRAVTLPDVPTVAQSDAHARSFDVSSWNALAAPAGTPAAAVARLNRHVNDALHAQHVRDQLLHLGVDARGGTPGQLSQLLASETQRWKAVVQRTGLAQ